MMCTCGKYTIRARHDKRVVNFCTHCGQVTRFDRQSKKLIVIWPGRIYGMKKVSLKHQ